MKIYVAGPYSANNPHNIQLNVDRAIDIGCELIKRGHNPFIPHLTHYVWLRPEGDFSYDKWCELDVEWLKLCDALYFIGSSNGANAELELAKKLGLKIFYSLEEVK